MADAENQVIFGKLSFSLLWAEPCFSGIYGIGDHSFPGQTQSTNPLQELVCSPKGWLSHERVFFLQCP